MFIVILNMLVFKLTINMDMLGIKIYNIKREFK